MYLKLEIFITLELVSIIVATNIVTKVYKMHYTYFKKLYLNIKKIIVSPS